VTKNLTFLLRNKSKLQTKLTKRDHYIKRQLSKQYRNGETSIWKIEGEERNLKACISVYCGKNCFIYRSTYMTRTCSSGYNNFKGISVIPSTAG